MKIIIVLWLILGLILWGASAVIYFQEGNMDAFREVIFAMSFMVTLTFIMIRS